MNKDEIARTHASHVSLIMKVKPLRRNIVALMTPVFARLVDQFITHVNEDIETLNQRIKRYNGSTIIAEKLNILQTLFNEHVRIDNKYPANIKACCQDYQVEFHEKLFIQFQHEFNQAGIKFLHKKPVFSTAAVNQERSDALSEFIENMPQEKAALLVAMLADRTLNQEAFTTRYTNLYNQGERGYNDFQLFLSTHYIPEPLGGTNGLNFKIIFKNTALPIDTPPAPCVLKIESQFGRPTYIVDKLRSEGLNTTLTHIAVERHVTYIDHTGDHIAKTLTVTDFCDGGDLETYTKKLTNPDEKIKSILVIYIQMAEALKIIQEKNCLFSDMKNTNWLITKKNKCIQIADTKGFIPAKDGQYNEQNDDNIWFCLDLLHSSYISPLEFTQESCVFSVDKAHVYMLGKNIYQALTGCNFEYLYTMKEATEQDFNHPIFQTQEGSTFKALIEPMIREKPEYRPSLTEILEKLYTLKQQNLSRQPVAALRVSNVPQDQNKLNELLKIRRLCIQNQLLLKTTLAKRAHDETDEDHEDPKINE